MRVFLGLGSNLEPETNISLALIKLGLVFGTLEESRRYRAPAIGFIGPDFVNMVVGFRTALSPTEVAELCQQIEREVGRKRELESGTCSRCIDIDLLLFENPDISVPEPRSDIRDFAYTAKPLADIYPHWRHELTGGEPLFRYAASKVFSDQKVELLEE